MRQPNDKKDEKIAVEFISGYTPTVSWNKFVKIETAKDDGFYVPKSVLMLLMAFGLMTLLAILIAYGLKLIMFFFK